MAPDNAQHNSAAFVRTETVLDKILAHKVEEIAAAKAAHPLADMNQAAQSAPPPRDFLGALRAGPHVALIAEVKHASPSRGVLIDPFDPQALGRIYAENGAACISVLTDERFFQGHLDFLGQVRTAAGVPVLRKDFIIDAYQVHEARAAGADAVLLIVAALSDAQLADLHAAITGLGMAALVEVHNEAELERALKLNPSLIGVNNRDLKTFAVDTGTTARVAQHLPAGVTLVGESGIFTPDDVAALAAAGASAILVGEALVTAPNTGDQVRALSSVPREATS